MGLLVGDPAQPVTRVLLTIDYTEAVAREGQAANCDGVIAYHPPIFAAIKRIDGRGLIHDAIRRGLAIYSPHTALDVAEGGTNDVLCDVLGLAECHPLRLAPKEATHYKLVTFVPAERVEEVSEALFAAGAGRIGKYSSCSFRTRGTGTFFGEEGSNPAVGQSGRLEQATEVRLETVLLIDKAAEVIRALRSAHPYEEPAFDLNQLAAPPEGPGQGRLGVLDPPVERAVLFDRLRRELAIEHLLVAGPVEGTVSRAAVCAGACGEMLTDAIAAKADLYLTGEMRHHDALRQRPRGSRWFARCIPTASASPSND